jgi:hypothetical protein
MAGAGSGRPPGGEGNSDPIYLTYLFQHFGLDKIRDIMNRPDGKTFQQRIDHLREVRALHPSLLSSCFSSIQISGLPFVSRSL